MISVMGQNSRDDFKKIVIVKLNPLFAVTWKNLAKGALNEGLSVFLAICHLHLRVTGDSISFF